MAFKLRRECGAGWAALAALAAALAACDTPPAGDRSGRVEISDTTPAEAGDVRPLPADFVEYSDQLAQQLISDLDEYAALRPPAGERYTVIFGDIENQTGIVSTADFEVVRERMKSNLLQSPIFREEFRFLQDRRRLEELQRQELGVDLLGRDASGRVANPRIDPNDTLLLNGTMYRVARGGASYYLMNFELVRFADGEVVWGERYETKRW